MEPVAGIHKTPLWLREDIARIFPESALAWSIGGDVGVAQISGAGGTANGKARDSRGRPLCGNRHNPANSLPFR
jgi:hypothetical protein